MSKPGEGIVFREQGDVGAVLGSPMPGAKRRLQAGDGLFNGESRLLEERAEPAGRLMLLQADLRMLVDAGAQRDEVVPHRVDFRAHAILGCAEIVHPSPPLKRPRLRPAEPE